MQSLSIVLPAWNEQGSVGRTVQAALGELDKRGMPGEVIVVDDGSTDQTWPILEGIAEQEARLRVIRHPVNLGYGAALARGIAGSRGEYLFLTDADLQFDLRELSRLEPFTPRFDVIVGYREARADPLHRRLNARIWNAAVHGLLDVGVRDVDCAFKLVRRTVFDRIRVGSSGAFAASEMLVAARRAGFCIHEVPVTHFPRCSGEATGARPGVIARAVIDLGRYVIGAKNCAT